MRGLIHTLALAACLAAPAMAKDAPKDVNAEESGGILVNFLQNTLSDDSRTVRVSGLEGAFSSRATIRELTVSDDQGVWLTLRGAVLDWNRLALVRGRFSVNTLSADEIVIARAPGTTTTEEDLPTPEATPFRVPDLPVSIELGELHVGRFVLAEPVVGHAAELGIDGFLTLADGALDTSLTVMRLDRAGDSARLVAGFANQTSRLKLDLDVTEASGGLISATLNMPDRPPLRLHAAGEGPVSDFSAIIGLASDGLQRVSGEVRLSALAPADAGGPSAGIGFAAGLNGDVTPFLPSEYREFFGTRSRLSLSGQRLSDGALSLSDLSLTTDAVQIRGSLAMAADGRVDLVDLRGAITPPDGKAVVLPVSGPETSIADALFSVQLDRAAGDDWTVSFRARDLRRPDLTLDQARIDATGHVGRDGHSLQGQVAAALSGIGLADPALAAAVGSAVELDGGFALAADGSLNLNSVKIHGTDYRATVDGLVRGLDTGFEMEGSVEAGLADLSRFSALAGQQLGGAITAKLTGKGAPLSGSFDIVLNARAQGLRSGNAQVDPLIDGTTQLTLDAARDETGTRIRRFDINGQDLSASVTGKARTGVADLKLSAKVKDLGVVLPDLAGPLQLAADVTLDGGLWAGTVDLVGSSYSARVDGTAQQQGDRFNLSGAADAAVQDLSQFSELAGRPLAGAVSFHLEGTGAPLAQLFDIRLEARARDLGLGIGKLDPLIAGQTLVSVDATRDRTGLVIRKFELNGKELSASASGQMLGESGSLTLAARLAELNLVVPQLNGPLTLTADLTQDNKLWGGKAELKGPQASRALLVGSMTPDGTARVDFDAALTRLERLIPSLPGTATAKGNAERSPSGAWQISAAAQGPGGITGDVSGGFNEASGQADLRAAGQLNLNLANLFIAPNSVDGLAKLDLTLKGTPSVQALAGTITTTGASFAIPAAAQTVNNIAATVTIADGQARVLVDGGLRGAKGSFRVSGPVALIAPFDSRIAIDISGIGLTDRVIFSTTLDGQLLLAGPLLRNPSLSGQILFGETDINLNAATSASGAPPIPPIVHVSEPAPVHATRARAGLTEEAGAGAKTDIGLDLRLIARNRVYVHGFGLQAEMAGDIAIRGSTARVAPAGQIEMIRGTLDILGRKLKLTRGIITMQGDLQPYVEFQSTTSTSDGQATIEISGPVNAPEVKVFADPDRPAEEALAMLLFGNRFTELSPFVIAQMAASLARMGGAGGNGSKSLRDMTGLDSVGVEADSNGRAQARAGAYLSDNIYTEFTVNADGETEVNLNLDLTESLSVRGTVDNTGATGLGVYFGRDY